ncbi:hypothetical protein J437_LFUL014669 [Ladona fulva]|uniref:Uncharacterized protein n=1 Tax=Ladona fulva TaxID=123851 RepID=A0A8K0KGK7_LADFU|nr:hypothetical protein J437_LFUL014669 [Ladona fulva]
MPLLPTTSPPRSPSPTTPLSLLKNSIEDLANGATELTDGTPGGSPSSPEPLVTFPDPDTPPTPGSALVNPLVHPLGVHAQAHAQGHFHHVNSSSKFEQKMMTSASKTKVVRDSFSAERATANTAEVKRVQAGDVSYSEQSAASAVRARMETEGVTAEKTSAMKQVGKKHG